MNNDLGHRRRVSKPHVPSLSISIPRADPPKVASSPDGSSTLLLPQNMADLDKNALLTPVPQVMGTPHAPPPMGLPSSPTLRNRLGQIWAQTSEEWNMSSPALEGHFHFDSTNKNVKPATPPARGHKKTVSIQNFTDEAMAEQNSASNRYTTKSSKRMGMPFVFPAQPARNTRRKPSMSEVDENMAIDEPGLSHSPTSVSSGSRSSIDFYNRSSQDYSRFDTSMVNDDSNYFTDMFSRSTLDDKQDALMTPFC